jgi:hypothetical protein
MKKSGRPARAALVLAAIGLVAAAPVLVVKVQTTQLRQTPQFFGSVIAPLKAGDKLEKLGEQNAWYQVKTAAGLTGWIHSSAAEVPKFTLIAMAGPTKTQATAQEAALAGKGFSKEIEASYRARHPETSFVWVERMLAFKVAAAEAQDFLKKGKLAESGRGQ